MGIDDNYGQILYFVDFNVFMFVCGDVNCII